MLAKRLATALVAIPIILYIVYLGGIYYSFLIGLIALIGLYEYLKMLHVNEPALVFLSLICLAALFVAVYYKNTVFMLVVLGVCFLLSILNLLLRFEKTDLKDSAAIFWGFMYVGGLLGFLLLIRVDFVFEYTVFLFVVVWLSDTFAYFAGRKWGNKKLAPVLSPGKTVAGSVGGFVGTAVFLSLFYIFLGDFFPLGYGLTILLTVIITFLAQVGDLVESAVKRKLDAKDSGGIVPGHGGVLDRFDSIMFAAPFTYLFLFFFAG